MVSSGQFHITLRKSSVARGNALKYTHFFNGKILSQRLMTGYEGISKA
jgi:hypothetical protein